jgi:hypothetical protein
MTAGMMATAVNPAEAQKAVPYADAMPLSVR